MENKLFIPGPINVKEDVLKQLSKQMIGHRTKEISALQKSISEKLGKLFYTKNEILLSTSSGSGLMEGTIRSCTAKKAAVFSVGDFGNRWYDMAQRNGVPSDKYEVEWGTAITPEMVDKALATGEYDLITVTHNETSTGVTNPLAEIGEIVKKYPNVIYCVDAVSSAGGTKIEVDKWGIDVCITSTQKSLGLPPGLAICTFSEKAYERAKTVKNRGFYFDMVEIYETVKKKDYQYISTPNIPLMFALDYQLDKILEEGLDNRFNRHAEMAQYIRNWASKNFEIFADKNHLSNTVTTIKNNKEINVGDFIKKLITRGFEISNGYGSLKEKTFRISTMGDYTMDDVKALVKAMNEVLEIN